MVPLNSLLRLGSHMPYAATIALSLGTNQQVDRLKRLMVNAVDRREGGRWLSRVGLHSMAWNVQSQIGRKVGRPWSRYQLYYFQLGFCRWCGLGKQRWIGEAVSPDQ